MSLSPSWRVRRLTLIDQLMGFQAAEAPSLWLVDSKLRESQI